MKGIALRTRPVGKLSASVVGLGCNNFGMRINVEQSAAVVDAALDEVIALFDSADIYGETNSEEFLRRALGARRTDIIIATKFGMAVDADRQGATLDTCDALSRTSECVPTSKSSLSPVSLTATIDRSLNSRAALIAMRVTALRLPHVSSTRAISRW